MIRMPEPREDQSNLFVVKEEPRECVHKERDLNGSEWPMIHELEVDIWSKNQRRVVANRLHSLDLTLFRYNMSGWRERQDFMLGHKEKFTPRHTSCPRGLLVV